MAVARERGVVVGYMALRKGAKLEWLITLEVDRPHVVARPGDEARVSTAILRALSDTHNVDTQGPVWYVEGKAV